MGRRLALAKETLRRRLASDYDAAIVQQLCAGRRAVLRGPGQPRAPFAPRTRVPSWPGCEGRTSRSAGPSRRTWGIATALTNETEPSDHKSVYSEPVD